MPGLSFLFSQKFIKMFSEVNRACPKISSAAVFPILIIPAAVPQVYLLFLVVDQLFLDFKNIWDTTIKGREVSYDPQIFEFLTC